MIIINSKDSAYPSSLLSIDYPPKNLHCRGDISLLRKYLITVVGTRDITDYGREVVNGLISMFKDDPRIAFVSGLAKGIDGEVHLKCLKYNVSTIAITATDGKVSVPKLNWGIYDVLCKKALIISEYSDKVCVCKKLYPIRNRILAGISNIVIVVEAGLNSGSLITAGFALDYNREVFVVPGNIFKNTSQGCNMLIGQGAGVLENFDEFHKYVQSQIINY